MVLQFPHQASDKTLAPKVVVRRPHEVLSVRSFKHTLKVCDDTDIGDVDIQLDSDVPRGVLLTDLSGAISRGVVGNNNFKIVVVLRQKAVERTRNISLSVVNGQANAD